MNVKNMRRKVRRSKRNKVSLNAKDMSPGDYLNHIIKHANKEVLLFNQNDETSTNMTASEVAPAIRNFIAPTDDVIMWSSKNVSDKQSLMMLHGFSNKGKHFEVQELFFLKGGGGVTVHLLVEIEEAAIALTVMEMLVMSADGTTISIPAGTQREGAGITTIKNVAITMRDMSHTLSHEFEVLEKETVSKSNKPYSRNPPKGVSVIQVRKVVRNKNYLPPTTGTGSKQAPCNVIRHVRYLRDIKYSKDDDGNRLPLRYDNYDNPYYKIAKVEPYKKGGGVDNQIKIYQKG